MTPFEEKSLCDDKGNPSSTRLIAYRLATKFFPIFNYAYMGLMMGLAFIMAQQTSKDMSNLINFFLATSAFVFTMNTTLLAYVFVSKKAGKESETTQIVEMAKVLHQDTTKQ